MSNDWTEFNLRPVPRTGVIYVMNSAAENGYKADDLDWVNLGQGAPEVGKISGFNSREVVFHLNEKNLEYGPVEGTLKMRQAVAHYYNSLYRKGLSSQYTEKNVSIVGGGRLALARLASVLGSIHVGHFLPDYTAFEELLDLFRAFIPIPIVLDESKNYTLSVDDLEKEIEGKGLGAILFSNPSNPTGRILKDEMQDWVQVARNHDCLMLVDEFYSHYCYHEKEFNTVSMTKYVKDVNKDPVVVINGLTKNWRLPGFRLAWIVGPEPIIQLIHSAGSFLDGGANHALQDAVLPLMDMDYIHESIRAIQSHFKRKRDLVYQSLQKINIPNLYLPESTFYYWLKIPQDGFEFFQDMIQKKTILVPGVFFDINPGHRRQKSRFQQTIRLSFGPPESQLMKGIQRITF